jgi:hypothetical protein
MEVQRLCGFQGSVCLFLYSEYFSHYREQSQEDFPLLWRIFGLVSLCYTENVLYREHLWLKG